MSRPNVNVRIDDRGPAHVLDAYVASLTNSSTETRFWGPIQQTLAKASEQTEALAGRQPCCLGLADLAGELNRIALCAYLQGFDELATELVTRQLDILAGLSCGCARFSEVQPWVNLTRLARAVREPRRLAAASRELASALGKAAAIDLNTLPEDLAAELREGSWLAAVEGVTAIEAAKLSWVNGELSACERLSAPLAATSGIAMELTVRCLLEGERWDQVIGLAAANASRYPWLRPYAAVALLRGGADDAFAQVVASLGREAPLPLLRLGLELAHAERHEEARELGEGMLAESLENGNEAASLLAGAFLIQNDYPFDIGREELERLAATSWHHPFVRVYDEIAGHPGTRATTPEARQATISAAEAALAAMSEQGSHAAH